MTAYRHSFPLARPARRALLFALVAAVAVFWLAFGRAGKAADVPPPAAASTEGSPGQAPQAASDPFAVRSWAPPPPPPPPAAPLVAAKPPPPPKPQAPPLPFRFLGKIVEPGKGTAFLLARGDRVVSVGVGDAIDENYLVEKYEGGRLYFVYRPLKARQSISVGRDT